MIVAPPARRRPELCVGAVVVHNGKLLLIRRGRPPAAGRWSVPGGRVEAGEPVAGAVIRELREETGLAGACGRLLGWVERIDDDRHYVILDFEVSLPGGRGATDARAGDDAEEVRWVPLEHVTRTDLVDGLARFLTDHGILGR